MSIFGVIGCGRMGRPMAEAMLAAGLNVRGRDVRPPGEFDDFAPHLAGSAAAFADGLEVAISVVRDASETHTALFGPDGLLRHANRLRLLVISSTLSPLYLAELREQVPAHIGMVDAPMSGAAIAAQERRLTFMLGGADADIDTLMPCLSAMGTTHHRIGPFGAGMTAKVLNNLVAASSTATTRLALAWADQAGLPRDTLLNVMRDASGQTWFGSHFEQIEFARDGYATDNSIGILAKDVEAAMAGRTDNADLALPRALVEALRKLAPMDRPD